MRPRTLPDVCTSPVDLAKLAGSWGELDTYLDAPFGAYPWVHTCAETLANDAALFVPMIHEGGTLVAAAPLVRSPHGLGVARQLGVAQLGEPADFNYRDASALERLAHRLAAAHVPLELSRTPVDSPLTDALRRAYGSHALVILRPRPDCPYIEISESEDDTTASLSSRLRSDLRRGARKAKEFGTIATEEHAPADERELAPLWKLALAVEAASWKGRNHSALQSNPRVGPFYGAYAARACKKGTLRILFLKLGDETAAMMIALEVSRRLWILKIGYDERFSRCSPGQLLMQEALHYAARRRLRTCEFLGTAEDWTRRWTSLGRATHGVFIYPYTPRGGAALCVDSVRFGWRRLTDREEARST